MLCYKNQTGAREVWWGGQGDSVAPLPPLEIFLRPLQSVCNKI